MKKMIKLLLTLLILYVIIQQIYYLFSKGHTINYTVKSGDEIVNIKEILSANKDEMSGYYIEVSSADYNIPFKIYKKYSKKKRIVKDVNIYHGDVYTCVELNIKNKKNETNIKCLGSGIVYYYNSIKGNDVKLDELISSSNYDKTMYISDEFSANKDNIVYYPNNYIDGQNVLLSLYKGAYIFGENVTNNARFVSLFDKDQYTKDIEGMAGKYYIVANYNSQHEFLSFNSINISTGTNEAISSSEYISFSSYVQGEAEGRLYIIDIENRKQYAVDPKAKKVELIGNINSGAQIYTKDGWTTKNMNDVINLRIKFDNNEYITFDNETYDRVKLIGREYGIYYLYKYNGNSYDAYMVYSEDTDYKKNYIFTTTDINRINYDNGNVYYIYDDEIRVFSINKGIRKLVKYGEIKYNSNLNFYVY